MDKNTITGLVLMGLIFVGYVWYSSSQSEEIQAQQEKARQEQMAKAAEEAAEQFKADSLNNLVVANDSLKVEVPQIAPERGQYGELLYAAYAENPEVKADTTITVKNSYLTVDFSAKGGALSKVTLEEYTKYAEGERNEKVVLFNPATAKFGTKFYYLNGQSQVLLNTNDFIFDLVGVEEGKDSQKVTFALEVMPGSKVIYEYTIYDKKVPSRDYLIDFDIRFENMKPILAQQDHISIEWSNTSYQNERGFKNENNYTTIAYRLPDEDEVEELDLSSEGVTIKQKVDESVNWVSFKQQFFSQTFIAHDNFLSADMKTYTQKAGSGMIKTFTSKMELAYDGQQEFEMSIYCGPNKYAILKDVVNNRGEDIYLEEVIPLGGWLIGWFNRWIIIPVMDFLSNHIANFGIIILILTLLVKALILPLTYKSYLSTAKMRVIKPEMDALNEKYPRKEDAMKKNQAMMELYKKAGVNPLGGCLPMLIQLPILWALFRFFPASIELRGESFLWAEDLSSYDSVLELPFTIPWYGDHVSLFALLMSIALMGFSYMSYKQTGAAQPQMGAMKFMMVYMMPVMMLLWFNDYASGLCYYYLVSQILTMIIMFSMRRFVDDKKIRAMMERTAAKQHNGKKSKFQLRYEEMMRQQEEMMQQKKGKR